MEATRRKSVVVRMYALTCMCIYSLYVTQLFSPLPPTPRLKNKHKCIVTGTMRRTSGLATKKPSGESIISAHCRSRCRQKSRQARSRAQKRTPRPSHSSPPLPSPPSRPHAHGTTRFYAPLPSATTASVGPKTRPTVRPSPSFMLGWAWEVRD